MASSQARSVVLMSINPQYASLILSGAKKVEFRKRRLKRNVSHIVIYVTAPVKKITGYFKIKNIEEETPSKLWKRYKEVGGIKRNLFRQYYSNSFQGVAIEVDKVFTLNEPVSLSTLGRSIGPPQSFAYLNSESLQRLKKSQIT